MVRKVGILFGMEDTFPWALMRKTNFDWMVANMADLLIERALHPRPFVATGSWPEFREQR